MKHFLNTQHIHAFAMITNYVQSTFNLMGLFALSI